MNCSYHPSIESREKCSACTKSLCADCAHKVKGRPYCQDCLIQGAEWATTVKGLRIPSDSPRRAALCAIIPGVGAVYNNEYIKAVAYFAVWAALIMMGNRVHGVFGFGALVFLVYTMFDSYRTAELKTRLRLETGFTDEPPRQDATLLGWGIFLIVLGVLFLLQNIIPYYLLNQLWPLAFVLLGGYLVYRALQAREGRSSDARDSSPGRKEGF